MGWATVREFTRMERDCRPMTQSAGTPPARRFVLFALLGVALAFVVAWQTGVPLRPASLSVSWTIAGLTIGAATSLLLYHTGPGTQLRTLLAETRAGQLLVLVVGIVVLVLFRGVHAFPYTAELASATLGASLGSLAPLLGKL